MVTAVFLIPAVITAFKVALNHIRLIRRLLVIQLFVQLVGGFRSKEFIKDTADFFLRDAAFLQQKILIDALKIRNLVFLKAVRNQESGILSGVAISAQSVAAISSYQRRE